MSIVDSTLRLGHGFRADERDHVVSLLHRLDHRLRTFGADRVDLEITVKSRDDSGQRTALEAKLGRLRRMVATSEHEDVDRAIVEVREELIRQVTDATNRTEPKNNRRLR